MANVSSSNGLDKRPKLRFPGFDEPWATKHFSDVFSFLPNNTLSRADLLSDGDVQNIHYGDVLIKYGSIIDAKCDDIPTIAHGKESKGIPYLRDGDIIIADTAEDETVGKCCEIININDTKIESGLHTIPCRPTISFTPMFLGYYMNSHHYHKQLIPLMQGVKVLSISKSNIEKTQISVPHSCSEQKKIVDLMHLIDIRIQKQQQIIETLKKYKRGLLKAVLTREVQLDSSLHWERRSFSEIAYLSKEKYVPKQSESILCIELEHLEQNTGRIIGHTNSSEQNSVKSTFRKGDVLFGKLRPYLRKFALPEFDGVCSSEIWVLRPMCGIDSSFLFYLVQSEGFIAAANISSGTKMPRAEWSKVSNESFSVPTLPEQVRISQVFSSLDHRIANSISCLDALHNLKHGLLQRLFI